MREGRGLGENVRRVGVDGRESGCETVCVNVRMNVSENVNKRVCE